MRQDTSNWSISWIYRDQLAEESLYDNDYLSKARVLHRYDGKVELIE